jgi:hypothetical protein
MLDPDPDEMNTDPQPCLLLHLVIYQIALEDASVWLGIENLKPMVLSYLCFFPYSPPIGWTIFILAPIGQLCQVALEHASVCLINATATGTEILKSLVLPGLGSFTILDANKEYFTLFLPQQTIFYYFTRVFDPFLNGVRLLEQYPI